MNPYRALLSPIVLMLALAGLGHATTAQRVSLDNSIRAVAEAATSGALDFHKPAVIRHQLEEKELDEEVFFSVVLNMHRYEEFKSRLANGDTITQAEMDAAYNPSPEEYQKVVTWLTGQGFAVTQTDVGRVFVFARGNVRNIQAAMGMTFAKVRQEGEDFTSAITPPQIPDTLAPLVMGINGLQTHIRAKRHISPLKAVNIGSIGTYTPAQVAHAYGYDYLQNLGLNGAGQTTAVVIDTFPNVSDLNQFYSTYNLSQSSSNVTFVRVSTNTYGPPTGEETLDVEWASAVAPGSRVRVYGSYALQESYLEAAYNAVYSDAVNHPEYGIHSMTMSYAYGEQDVPGSIISADELTYSRLVQAGVTSYAASGDQGSSFNGKTQATYPAGSAYVVGVGGTTVYLDSSNNVTSETGWSLADGVASSGGITTQVARPSWQTGTGVRSGSTRLVPDISIIGDPQSAAAVVLNGSTYSVGGTSLGAPLWSGLHALFNHARVSNRQAVIGLNNQNVMGSLLYPLIGTSNFRDIVTGNNGAYACTTGYDLVTGIGVPNVTTLAQTLASGVVLTPLSVLHAFGDGSVASDGHYPSGRLILASDGNFYGVTNGGGTAGYGTFFRLTTSGAITILHNFGDGSVTNDGRYPVGVIQGSDGNFYGTTSSGSYSGTIYRATSAGAITILHQFNDGLLANDGITPNTGLVQGADGTLYGGTSSSTYPNGYGTIYSATTSGSVKTLQALNFNTALSGDLIRGSDGNFYGMTLGDGPGSNNNGGGSYGTIFRMTPAGGMTVLHFFGGNSSSDPFLAQGSLLQASDGNFYGVTSGGGSAGNGTLFRMTSAGVFTVLHNFGDGTVYGDLGPFTGLAQGTDGNLYGTSRLSTLSNGYYVFRCTTSGAYASFFQPAIEYYILSAVQSPLTVGSDGNFYGLSNSGGTGQYGTLFRLLARQAPQITSASTVTMYANYSNSFTLTTTGTPTPTLSGAGTLPSGLSYNSSTATISGRPSTAAISSSPYTLAFTSANGVVPAATQQLQITVQSLTSPQSPNITSSAINATLTVGTPYTYPVSALGNPAPTIFLASGSLPPGLTLASNGAISGTPTQEGTYTGTFRASNVVGSSVTQGFTMTVQRPPNFTSGYPTAAQVGSPYSFSFTSSGSPAVTYSITDRGALPTNLSLSSSGVLSGTPLTGQGGGYTFTVQVTNAAGTAILPIPNFTINEAPTFLDAPINALISPNGYYNLYPNVLGYPLVSFALASGAIPPGMNLSSSGILAGSPSAVGVYTGTFSASNSLGTATQPFTITVGTSPSLTSYAAPATGTTGTRYTYTFASGGYPAPTYSITAGTLPPGLSLSSAGVLSGAPTTAGIYSFTVTSSNAFGSNSQNLTITISSSSLPQTDTPTLPEWALMLLAGLIPLLAWRQLLRVRPGVLRLL